MVRVRRSSDQTGVRATTFGSKRCARDSVLFGDRHRWIQRTTWLDSTEQRSEKKCRKGDVEVEMLGDLQTISLVR